jgi:DNA-binding transcriptional ArsR family regulator
MALAYASLHGEVEEQLTQSYLWITKALSDETRVRALLALQGRELCVCQIIDLLGLAPSTVSKHMSILQQAGLVTRRKEGRWHFYHLVGEEASSTVRQALSWTLESLHDDPTIAEDRKRLKSVCKKDLEELSACYRN